mgnify:CR=1 FL=1
MSSKIVLIDATVFLTGLLRVAGSDECGGPSYKCNIWIC